MRSVMMSAPSRVDRATVQPAHRMLRSYQPIATVGSVGSGSPAVTRRPLHAARSCRDQRQQRRVAAAPRGPRSGPTARCRRGRAAGRAPRRLVGGHRAAARVEEARRGSGRSPACRAGSASAGGSARSRPSSIGIASARFASHRALDHDVLDLADRLRRIEALRADVDAIHDRVAAEQPVRDPRGCRGARRWPGRGVSAMKR